MFNFFVFLWIYIHVAEILFQKACASTDTVSTVTKCTEETDLTIRQVSVY